MHSTMDVDMDDAAAASPAKKTVTAPSRVPAYLAASPLAPLFDLAPPGGAATGTGIPLPSAWAARDKCGLLELHRSGLGVRYNGPGRSDADAAAVRANHAIPAECGVYYYEVDVLDPGRDGFIGIGFCAGNVSLNRLPGWEQASWGYHGDDGHIFQCSGTGKAYGPTFGKGDTVGCGINLLSRTAFFTRNGVHLGTAFKDLKFPGSPAAAANTGSSSSARANHHAWYPTVGLRTPHESVVANFGHAPFRFDIASYMREEKEKVWTAIHAAPLEPLEQTMHELVLGYLVHHGYKHTAGALLEAERARRRSIANATAKHKNAGEDGMEVETGVLSQQDDDISAKIRDMEQRGQIRDLILAGDIPGAVQALETYFPGVLADDPVTRFELDAQHFLELVAQGGDLLPALAYGRTSLSVPTYTQHPVLAARLRDLFSVVAYTGGTVPAHVAQLLDQPRRRRAVADAVNAAIQVQAGRRAQPALEIVAKHAAVTAGHLAARYAAAAPQAALVHVIRDVFGALQ